MMTEEKDDVFNIHDPELKRPVTVIYLLDQAYRDALNEIAVMEHFGDSPCPALAVFEVQMRSHSIDFPERMAVTEEQEAALDQIYGTQGEREFLMDREEADKRFGNWQSLWKDIGPGTIDEWNAYLPDYAPDRIDFSVWGED